MRGEAVRLTCNPRMVSYCELLEAFFSIHDQTRRNRQGNDLGTLYRSAIHSATFSLDGLQRYTAEAHDQNYFLQPPDQSYSANAVANLDKFRKTLARLRKSISQARHFIAVHPHHKRSKRFQSSFKA
ncbi:MAG TPA: peptide-methionine (S)-S-oxide reductase [Rhodocyclaceae bacterium]|nr:peptide-methionine (S)-S-oxide reductase [Rhodocyclaceae bacterium]